MSEIKNIIKKHDANLVGLIENKLSHVDKPSFNRIWNFNGIEYLPCDASPTHSRGILLAWKNDNFSTINSYINSNWIGKLIQEV